MSRSCTAAFEDWRPASGAAFDLVVAATSWHWIDPGVRYERAFDLLRDGGHLAFWKATHVFPDGGDPFFRDIQDVYDEIGEGMLGGPVWPRPGELPDERAEIEATGLFDGVHVGQYDWEVVYDADGVHRPARDVLGPHLHGAVAARAAVCRDPAAAGGAA